MRPSTIHRSRFRNAAGIFRGRASLFAYLLLAWLSVGVAALAQSASDAVAPMAQTPDSTNAAPAPPASPPTTESNATESPKSKDSSDPAVYGLLQEEGGTVVPVPLPPGTDPADFVEWMAAKRGPGYGVNSVELTGQVQEGNRIELQAAVSIVVHRDDEWVRVPLAFNEAIIGNVVHEGKGSYSYDSFSDDEGHAWKLQGAGEHRLILTLLAPILNEIDETELTLTTPTKAATTTVRLDFAGDVEAHADAGVMRQTRPTEQTSSANWVGPGGRIEISWHPRPETASPEDLTVSTSMAVTFNSQSRECELRARQRIKAAKGRISNVEVELPDGFKFQSVEGESVRPGTAQVSDDGRTVSLDLEEPQTGPVELNWRLAAPLLDGSRFTISDFSIPGVPEAKQSGEIKFEQTAAYDPKVVQDEGATTGVTRTGMVSPGEFNVTQAYEFEQQPFALTFDVTAITPNFEVSPELIFTIQPDRLDLDATFGVSVERGELREMRFVWPAQGWNITPIRAGYIQETERSIDETPAIELQVPNWTSFDIPILATKRRDNIVGTFEIPLPRLDAMSSVAKGTSKARIVAIRHPNNLKVEARAADGTPLPDPDPDRAVGLPQPSDNDGMKIIQVPATVEAIQFNITRILQQIATDTAVTVRPRGEMLIAEQRFDYNIRFEPLSVLHFRIPEPLFDQGLEFVDGSVNSYRPQEVSRDGGFVEAVVNLATSIQGPVSLTTSFHVSPDIERAKSGSFAIPVIMPTDGTIATARIEVSPLPYHRVTIDSPDWQPVTADDATASEQWQSSSASTAIPLTLTARPPDAVIRPTLRKVLMRSVVNREGQVSTIVDSLLDRRTELLVLEFPIGTKPRWFRWRGHPIEPEITTVDGRTQAELELEEGAGNPVLSFEYDLTMAHPLGFLDREQIPSVDFGDDVAVDEVVWRVSLPESEHLFTNPTDYSPRFEWRLDQGFWSRETVPSLQELTGWFGAELTTLRPEFEGGHKYVFSREGDLEPLEFSIIAKSLVVLVGAGLAILLGYTFANGLVPHIRYVLPGLVAVLLLMWAFFPSQMRLFLQPAILGFFLVAAALVAERVLQRRQERLAAAETNSAVDFVTILPGDGSTSTPTAGIGSEEPTVVRANVGHESRDT